MAIHPFDSNDFHHRSLVSRALFERPRLYLHYSLKHAERYFRACAMLDGEDFSGMDEAAKERLILERAKAAIEVNFDKHPELYGGGPNIEIGNHHLTLTFTTLHDPLLLKHSFLQGLAERKTNNTKLLLLSPAEATVLWEKVKRDIPPTGPSRTATLAQAAGGYGR